MTEKKLVSLREAALALSISEKTLRNQLSLGKCPLRTVKIGSRRLVPVSELERIVAAAAPGRGGAA